MQKLLGLSGLLLIAFFTVQCSDPITEPFDNPSLLTLNKGGGGEESAGNNLSFPAFLADDYVLIPISQSSFTTSYTGPNTGLSDEELALLAGSTWYAQKVEGNIWQAEFQHTGDIDVTYIDWGDNVESFSPKVGKPFRLEVTLYKDVSSDPMTGYKMALLAFPSSPDEIQGTNTETYESNWATIASNKAKLVVQRFECDPSNLVWNGDYWTNALLPENVVFAVELNVGGKLIYGAAEGGWKPQISGKYRLTFFLPNSQVNLRNATIGSVPTTQVAFPQVDAANNLSYVDVEVVAGGGGGKKK